MTSTLLPPPPRQTANPSPLRAVGSVRRTASIDVAWPDGMNGDRRFFGRARDYLTPHHDGAGRVIDGASMEATLDPGKLIKAISAYPEPARLQRLVGERGGNHLRMVLREQLPELIATGAPLYLLLDDISGVALVSSWAWAQWEPDWQERLRESMASGEAGAILADRVNVCWGLQEGNSGVDPDHGPSDIGDTDAGELRNPADPDGWHEFPLVTTGPSFRRARRIDVTRDDNAGLIRVDSAFQDSAPDRTGRRSAIHEYRLVAAIDADTHEIVALEPEARILPFSECPGAIHNARQLVGTPIDAIRQQVLAQLRGPQGCTHLNDALRALADVEKLVSLLDEPMPA